MGDPAPRSARPRRRGKSSATCERGVNDLCGRARHARDHRRGLVATENHWCSPSGQSGRIRGGKQIDGCVAQAAPLDVIAGVAVAPSVQAVRDADARIPNSDDVFPTREDYIKFGYAIRAAVGAEHDDDAFEIFADWAARWDGGQRAGHRAG